MSSLKTVRTKSGSESEALVADQEEAAEASPWPLQTRWDPTMTKEMEELEEQIARLEEPLELRIQEFYLERDLIEARAEGENVPELEAELQVIRKALSELHDGGSN